MWVAKVSKVRLGRCTIGFFVFLWTFVLASGVPVEHLQASSLFSTVASQVGARQLVLADVELD